MDLVYEIKKCIEQQLDKNQDTKFIIFPFGNVGRLINNILKEAYGINANYILDNHFCKYNSNIKPLTFLNEINCKEYVLILAITDANFKVYSEIKQDILKYIDENSIIELHSTKAEKKYTSVGKYSYGPLCNHWLVESVGAFCSFAQGCDVVVNHAIDYISTHPFIYYGKETNYVYEESYSNCINCDWYFNGVSPKGTAHKLKKIKIGNDVWLGKNVIITNSSNIGNGVIAGAGSIITKDIPDYAVVVGAPAKIIRYRYTPEQIEALNKIQWWNWSDDEIRKRYNDFYLPIEEFIQKHNN